MQEQWRPIPGFEGHYEASDLGQVRSVERAVCSHADRRIRIFKGRILKQELQANNPVHRSGGYYVVKLSKNGICSKHYVHSLVLKAFIGPCPEGQECLHGNDIRTDNRLENLSWDTHQANVQDTHVRGRYRNHNAEKTHCHRGHAFDEANTIIRPTGRSCLECRRLNERARYHGNKGNPTKQVKHDATHCQRGHLFDEANTYIRPNGKRNCRKCKRFGENAWYHRQKDYRKS